MRPPNIIVLHCHDLGAHLGCYGQTTVQSPNLDRFAAHGVVAEYCRATAPQCSPARASLFTGRYPHANGVMGLTHSPFDWDLKPDEIHLAAALRQHGYRTAVAGVTHEAATRDMRRHGFDEILPCPRSFAQEVVDAACDFLARCGPDRPCFRQAGFVEPHRLPHASQPGVHGFLGCHLAPDLSRGTTVPGYLCDDEGARTEVAELQGAIRHLDAEVGRLFAALEAAGRWSDTIVLFTTDHGLAMPRAKCTLYEPGLEIACILRAPGLAPSRLAAPVSQVDLMPTLLGLAGLPIPQRVQGLDLTDTFCGRDGTRREELFGELTWHEYYDPIRSIRVGRHKLILPFSTAPAFMDCSQSWRPRSLTRVPADPATAYHRGVELYDLERDPWEADNRAADPALAGVRDDLLARLRHHLNATDDPILHGPVPDPAYARAIAVLGGSVPGWDALGAQNADGVMANTPGTARPLPASD